MRLASATTKYKLLFSLLLTISVFQVYSQENSPYSRYGLGDIVPGQSITSRGMGGISAGYVDYDKRYDLKQVYPKSQTINFLNPATYSKLRITSFDLAFEVDSRTLRSPEQAKKYTVSSAIISYLQLGIPLSRKKQLGLNLGLRPFTRINYKIQANERHIYPGNNTDSIRNLYEGSGGAYEVFAGIGKGFHNFSIGVNAGYFFGTKDYSTRKSFVNDTVLYHKSNYETKTAFGGLLVNAGVQYAASLDKQTKLVVGAYGNLRQTFNGNRDNTIETFNYDANGGTYRLDSVAIEKNKSGKIEYPSNMGIGFTLERLDKWMFGADFSTTKWTEYRFFGTPDLVRNSWIIRVGGQFTPDIYNPKSYFSRVTYRFGFNLGPDYIKADGRDLSQSGFSVGGGFPVRKNPYSNQFSYVNLALEYGRRGNNSNLLKENSFRVALGFTLSDLWFIKKKYD
jgi:hypothetical protein